MPPYHRQILIALGATAILPVLVAIHACVVRSDFAGLAYVPLLLIAHSAIALPTIRFYKALPKWSLVFGALYPTAMAIAISAMTIPFGDDSAIGPWLIVTVRSFVSWPALPIGILYTTITFFLTRKEVSGYEAMEPAAKSRILQTLGTIAVTALLPVAAIYHHFRSMSDTDTWSMGDPDIWVGMLIVLTLHCMVMIAAIITTRKAPVIGWILCSLLYPIGLAVAAYPFALLMGGRIRSFGHLIEKSFDFWWITVPIGCVSGTIIFILTYKGRDPEGTALESAA